MRMLRSTLQRTRHKFYIQGFRSDIQRGLYPHDKGCNSSLQRYLLFTHDRELYPLDSRLYPHKGYTPLASWFYPLWIISIWVYTHFLVIANFFFNFKGYPVSTLMNRLKLNVFGAILGLCKIMMIFALGSFFKEITPSPFENVRYCSLQMVCCVRIEIKNINKFFFIWNFILQYFLIIYHWIIKDGLFMYVEYMFLFWELIRIQSKRKNHAGVIILSYPSPPPAPPLH